MLERVRATSKGLRAAGPLLLGICAHLCTLRACAARAARPVQGGEFNDEVDQRRTGEACLLEVIRFSCVLEVTQTHIQIHIHTNTFTPWRVPRGGGLEGRHAHGELEAHGGGGEEYGSCVRENDGCRDSRAMVCKEGVGGGPREAITGWNHGWSARARVYQVLAARGRRWGRALPWSR
jgi:hypothetical protein